MRTMVFDGDAFVERFNTVVERPRRRRDPGHDDGRRRHGGPPSEGTRGAAASRSHDGPASHVRSRSLQDLARLLPTVSRRTDVRVVVLTNPGTDDRHAAVEQAAAALGAQHQVVTVARPEEIDDAFEVMRENGSGLSSNGPAARCSSHNRQRIADLAIQSRLPAACYSKEYGRARRALLTGVVEVNKPVDGTDEHSTADDVAHRDAAGCGSETAPAQRLRACRRRRYRAIASSRGPG